MSKNIAIRSLIVLPVLAFLAFVLAVADLGALAQNTNSSTTEGAQNENTGDAANANANANANTGGGRRRRGRRRAQQIEATDPTGEATTTDAAPASGAGMQETDTGVGAPGEAEDLSGTWAGRVRMTGGHEMSGEATLTITGNTFTLSSEGMSHTGRIIAITTRGYTGATFWFTDQTDPASNTPLAAAVRVRRRGNSLVLAPVPGARNRLNFNGRASAGS